ncbi:uncharacterized protein A4U43_C10F7640 [Asparagus officinalis]|uniref:serine C-palmitoyltransferase n=1 Tax=Asparagus officinalis TaxID=4686 RepID=A0A5P1E189_ASPOF|nr:uncharacterized protein A4U43_C10F7640 [Asparagus officinalis]
MILFSGNDYLGLSTHPSVATAAAKAALEHGMGPRGSALICGYTNYHRLLEDALAELKKKEVNFRYMLKSGFHVTAIRPPTVPPNSCRLRITLSAAHTSDDIRRLVNALSQCIELPHIEEESCQIVSKL